MSTVDRVDYSNDTATASPKGTLSSGRSVLGAMAIVLVILVVVILVQNQQ